MAGNSSVAAVQATNDDASASKLSCVSKGYIEDKYVRFFVRRPLKRSPIINRGYYSRWAAMRKLVLQFLEGADPRKAAGTQPRKQVLSLGAGFDTLFFQLKDEGRAPHLFVEMDFLEVTSRKAAIIASHGELVANLGPEVEIHKEKGEILSDRYKLLPADLRDLNGLDRVFKRAGLDPSLPTVVIAECVLIYLDPQVSRAVVKWAADKLTTAIFVIYEQIHPHDAFGQQMIKNLESRGCGLLGLEDTPTLEAKMKRFTDLGWQNADALNMDVIYNQHLDPIDRRRIERLEIFDEFEEWHIMQEHYCVAFGINDPTGILEHVGFTIPKSVASHLGHSKSFSAT
ncbi:unnamed protein product [Calypogeia fissa]